MKRESIAIFGASVTQQKDGYATHLRNRFAGRAHIFGYGGMHLSDAGVCFIDRVLAARPDYCFVDWFSTGYVEATERTQECIDTIIYRLRREGCAPVFLFLPREDTQRRAPFEEFCKTHLRSRGAFYIDVAADIGRLSGMLRDAVHTTEHGSERYAEIIYGRFMGNRRAIISPDINPTPRYADIKKLTVNGAFKDTLELEGKAEIIGFLLTIGPHSGLVDIHDKGNITRLNTWDVWCHYQRMHFNLHYAINGSISVVVLQDRFDTSASRQPFDYDSVPKRLMVHDIFYVGDRLTLLNRSAGASLKSGERVTGRGAGGWRSAIGRLLAPRLKNHET